MRKLQKNLFIGTSGYNYQHWKGTFYPTELSSSRWLEFYTQQFDTVELNVTFYRLPSRKVFQGWHKRTPKDFKFVIKGSRFITHIKKLKDCKDSLRIFFENASGLKNKIICVLWQLPPSLRQDLRKLSEFIALLKKYYSCYLHSMEFRHLSWFQKDTYELLKKRGINLCIADSPNFPCGEVLTSSFVYLRFHGGKILYGSEYSEEELKIWAQKAKTWLRGKTLLLAFFNNDAYGFAIRNALKFRELLYEKL